MLQHLEKVYLKVAVIDRKNPQPPTVFLDIYNRKEKTIIGQIRFNFDPNYSNKKEYIRMSFNVVDRSLIDPMRTDILEDIITAGFLWITLDNHYTYDFHPKPYMVIHNYEQDSQETALINSKIMSILTALECECEKEAMYVFSKDRTSKYLLKKLANSNN